MNRKLIILIGTISIVITLIITIFICTSKPEIDPLAEQFNNSVEQIEPFSHELLMAGVKDEAEKLDSNDVVDLLAEKIKLSVAIERGEATKSDELRYEYVEALLEEYDKILINHN